MSNNNGGGGVGAWNWGRALGILSTVIALVATIYWLGVEQGHIQTELEQIQSYQDALDRRINRMEEIFFRGGM